MAQIRQNAKEMLHLWVGKDLMRGSRRRNSMIHQYDLIRMTRHHTEIMGDEENGKILLCTQLSDNLIKTCKPALIDT